MDEVVGKTVVRVGMDYSEIKQGITNLNAQMKVADATWKSSLSTFKQSDRSLEKLSTSIKGMSDKLRVQEQIVEAHKVNVSKLTKEYGANSTKVLNATANLKKQEGIYGNLKRSINEMNNEIAENNAKLKESSIQQRIVTGQQEKMIKQSQMLEKQQASMTSKLKLADQEWKNNVTSLGNVYKAVDKAKVNLDGLNKKYDIQKKIVIEHAQELRKLSSTYGDTDERVVQANIKLKEQIGIFKDMKNDITNVTKELNELKRAEQLNNSPWTQRSKELQAYSDKMNAIGDKMTNIGQNMSMTVTTPIAAGFGAAVKTSMDFEAQMSRVGAIAGASKSELKAMSDQAMYLGASTSKSASEVAKGFEEMAAMGFSVKEIMGAMPGVISASESSGADMAQTAKVMASSMNAFGLEASKSTHIADVLAQTANQSAADITDMEYALKYAGAPAEALGVSLEETAAAIGLVVDKGMEGEQAGTGIKNMMLTLAENSQTTQKRLESIGLEVHDAEGKFIGISGVIEGLNKQLKGMSDMEKTGVLASLFGKDSAPAVLSLIEAGSDKIDKMTVSLENSDGASAKAAKQMKNNLKGAVEELGGAFETVGIQVGKDLTPMLSSLADGITKGANAFSELPDGVRKGIIGLGLFAGAIGPVTLGTGLFIKSVGTITGGMSTVAGKMAQHTLKLKGAGAVAEGAGTAVGKSGKLFDGVIGTLGKFGKGAEGASKATGLLTKSGGLLSRGLGSLGGPVGIALTAVTALYGGFKLAYKHVDWFRTGVDNTGKLLKEVAGSIDLKWAEDIGTTFKIGAGFARNLAGGLGDIAKKGIEMAPGTQLIKAGFGVINDAVSKATDKVDVYGKGVSKGTEKALKGYTDLSIKASKKLEELRLSHKTIGDKQYKDLVSLYDKMSNTAVAKISQRRNREITGLQKLFADTKGLKASEENKILVEAKSGANKEVLAVKSIQKQIKDIYKKAHNEKRALTKAEESSIVLLQQQMDSKVVKSLSKSEREQRIILGRLRDNKKTLTLQAAAEAIKNSARERDKTIADAKKKKKSIIDEAIYQRDVTKNISKDEADKIIKDAERKYKESKKHAVNQHKKVVKEAESQNREVKRNIDSQTGHVLSKWEKLKRDSTPIITGLTSIAKNKFKDMYKGVTGWMSDTKKDVEGKWEKFKGTTKTLANGVKDAAVGKFKEMYKGTTDWVTKIGTFISDSKTTISNKAGDLGRSVANSAISGLNSMIGGINSIYKGINGGKKNLISPIPEIVKKSNGGGIKKDTLAIVGDKGPGNGPGGFTQEIIKRKDGTMQLTPKSDTLVQLYKGDEVINGRTTHSLMKSGAIPRYNRGTDLFAKGIIGGFNKANDVLGPKKTIKTTKKVAKTVDKVKDFGEEIFEYMDNPGKLIEMVIGPIKNKFSNIGGATGKIALGAFNNIKSKLVGTVKGWFDEFGGNANGGEILGFPKTTPYSPNAVPKGYPFNAFHYGIDLRTPAGTLLHAPTSGVLSQTSDYNGGLTAILKDKIYTQFFMHLSKVLKTGPVKQGDPIVRTGNSGHMTTGAHLHYQVRKNDGTNNWNTNTIDPEKFLNSKTPSSRDTGGGSQGNWKPTVLKALAMSGLPTSAPYVNAWLRQIQTESGGRPTVIGGDDGLADGKAMGLVQVKPGTFRANMLPGHGNILNPLDNLIAGMRYAKTRYGSSLLRVIGQGHGYANGGIITKRHFAEVGEEGEEVIIPMTKKRRPRAQQLLAYANGVLNKDSRKYVKEPPKTHTVKSGDTLWGIAQANKMTVSMLKQLNNLKSNLIFPKQVLKLNDTAKKLVKGISEHATAIKQSITKKQTTAKPKVQMTSVTGVISKFADSLIRSGTIFKDLKISKTDLSFGKFLESKLKGLNSSNIKTVMTNVSAIKKKLTDIDKKNDKLIKTNNTKIKSATVKNFDEQLKIDNYKAEKALNGKKGIITVKTRIAARDTTMIDRNLAKSKLNKVSHEKDIKTLEAARKKLKSKKDLAANKKRIDAEKKQLVQEVANIKKYEAQRADALKLKYKTEKKYVTGRSSSALDKLINTSTNNIGKNKTLIKNLKSENALYAKQSATLKKIKGAEILKSDVLKKIADRREQLVKMMEALKKKETSLKEEKQGFADSISENLQSYAGFGGARGHTARDFVSWMRYRLGKMRTFASNIQKLKGMGLDPKLIREMLAGGIENAMPKVEALVKGGGGYISQINSLQKEIDGVVKSISTEQSSSLFADELADNKRRQGNVTKAMKANESKLNDFRNSKDKVVNMKSYTDLENKTSKYKYQAKPLPKKTTTSKATTTSGKYKVKSGDSLWLIANKYKTTIDNLKKLNGLKSNLIHPNQTLKVPGAAKSQKVVNLEAAKKKREDESTRLIVNTAKKLNVVGKNDKYAAQLQKEIADIRKTTSKKDDALVAKLEKEMKENKALTKEMVNLLSQILNKPTNVILDGQKVSKTVEKNIVTKAKTTARKTVTPKPKTPVRRKA